jgi:hypothetical protein
LIVGELKSHVAGAVTRSASLNTLARTQFAGVANIDPAKKQLRQHSKEYLQRGAETRIVSLVPK